MSNSIFWYDFESTGIDPRFDRPLQVAGVRTDENLDEIGEPLCIDCRLSGEVLPHPAACLVTGIGPERVAMGLSEAEFIGRLHEQMAQPGTCSAGYNNLRFDDEMTRFTLWRNFHDPYAREWQGGNSRWDLLDAMRTAQALRPEGIVWPEQDGLPSLRLELLTAANGIDHGQAHDALADVRATIALAKLLRRAQPKLYDYLYNHRGKQKVGELIDLQGLRPLVHVSGRFGRDRRGLGVVMPLGWHPVNRNALIVWDLSIDPSLLLNLDAETLRSRLYTKTEDLAEGESRPGLKLVHVNKCPVLADIKVLRDQDIERLGLDMPEMLRRAAILAEWRQTGQARLRSVYEPEVGRRAAEQDLDAQLYDGFIGDDDRRLLPMIREANGELLAKTRWPLKDQRLADMLFRYRARNFPESLCASEGEQWKSFCRERLSGVAPGAGLSYREFERATEQLLVQATPEQALLLQRWRQYARDQLRQCGLDADTMPELSGQ
jgi:exodeoxyribonuclease I